MPTPPENEPSPEPTDARLAPHYRVDPEHRVEGSYIVSVRATADPAAVAKRAGTEMDHAFTRVHAFAAHLTDEQVTALRRDPEVTQIEDNEHITLDD